MSPRIRPSVVVAVAAFAALTLPSCRLVADPTLAQLVRDRPAAGVVVERDVPYGASTGCFILTDVLCGGSQELDVHRSPVETDGLRPVLVWIHGGGWSSGDKSEPLPPNVRNQLGRGYDVVSVNYRLAPRYRYPVPLLDVKLALHWMVAQAGERGWDPDRILLVGHSAGGHLATLAALTGGVASLEPDLPPGLAGTRVRVAGAVSLNGVLDLRDSARRDPGAALMVSGLVGCGDCGFAEGASPGWWVDGGDPPIHLVAGVHDPLAPTRQALNLCIASMLRGSSCSVDLVDTGPSHGLGHHSWPSLHQDELEAFLDGARR